MKKKLIIMFVAALFVIGPIVSSASAETNYSTADVQSNIVMEEAVVPDAAATFVGGLLAGWVAGHALDAAWKWASKQDFQVGGHLCVSLPPEINGQDVKDAFGR